VLGTRWRLPSPVNRDHGVGDVHRWVGGPAGPALGPRPPSGREVRFAIRAGLGKKLIYLTCESAFLSGDVFSALLVVRTS
jgi:hypothetical protein